MWWLLIILGGIVAFKLLSLWRMPPAPNAPDEEKIYDTLNQEAAHKYEINSLREDIGNLQLLLNSKVKDLDEANRKLQEAQDKVIKQEVNNQKVLSLKKSSEIRLGNAAEQLAPFLEGFDHDPRYLRFLGSPIDYIAFDRDTITFIEIKSGNSHLSYNQKNIKRLIKEGKVKWQEFRVSGKQGRKN